MLNSLLYILLSRKPGKSSFTFDTAGKGFDQSIWHDPTNVFFTFDDAQKAFDLSVWSKYIPKAIAKTKIAVKTKKS